MKSSVPVNRTPVIQTVVDHLTPHQFEVNVTIATTTIINIGRT
jgi:hypothetical protein